MASKKIKGITVQIGGDTSGLTKALTQADKALAATQRELNEVQKGLKLDPSNVTLMAQKQELLTKAVKETADKLRALEENQDKARRAFEANGAWEAQYKPLKEKIDAAKDSLNKLKKEQEEAEKKFKAGTISAEDYEKINSDVRNAETALADLKKQEEELEKQFKDGHITAEQYRAYQREVETTRAQLASLEGQMQSTEQTAETTAVTSTESIKKFSESAKADFKAVVKAAAAITAALLAIGKQAVETGAEFDSAMSQVAATMGFSVEEINTEGTEANKTFKQLRDYAQEMGKTTAFSANESAQALNYMALAGYDAETSISMLPKVLDLASAGNIDLAKSSDMVTDAQSALGLSIEDTEVLIDQMAKTASKSNTSVEQLGDAILTIGATGRTAAGGTKELAQVLGLLADNGIKGSEGGTKLRNIILALQSPTDKAAYKLEKLGIKAYDSEGHFRALEDIFADLNGALAEMSDQDADIAKSTIFSKRDLAAVNALLNTTTQRWDELGNAIEDSAGAAHDMAEVQLDNLAGDVTLFKSALEGAEIAISDRLSPSLRNAVQFGTEMVSRLADGFGSGGLAGAVEQAHKVIAEQLGEDAKLIFGVETAVESLIGAFVTYKATMLLTEGITALKTVNSLLAEGKTLTEALNGAQMANPYVLIATLAVSAGIAIKKLIDIQTDLIEETSDSYDKLNDKQKELVDGAKDTAQAIADSRKSWKDSRAETEKQADSYRLMADKLYELNNAQEMNSETRAKMKQYADKLNGAIKGLNIEIDGETGRLKTQKSAVDDLIDSYEKEAQAQAARSHLTELYEQQISAELERKKLLDGVTEAEKNLADAVEKKNAAQQRYNALMETVPDIYSMSADQQEREKELKAALDEATKSVSDQKDALGELQGQLANTGQDLQNVNADIETCKGLMNEAGLTMDETADKTEEDTDRIADSAEKMKASIVKSFDVEEEVNKAVSKIEEIIKAYDDKLASRTGTLQSWFDVNATVSGQDASFNSLKSALDKQIDAMNQWKQDIATLEKEGINDNFLDKLKDAGPSSQALVTELLKVPKEKRNAYADQWYEAYSGAAGIAEEQLKKMKQASENEIGELINQLADKAPEFKAAWEALGGFALEGYIDGLRNTKLLEQVKEAVKEMTDASLGEAESNLDIGSPSKKTKKLGEYYSEGFAIGIADKLSDAVKASAALVDAALGAAKKTGQEDTADIKLPQISPADIGQYKQASAAPAVSAQEIAGATKNALGEILSGNSTVVVQMSGEEIGRITFPTIDALQGRETTLRTRGIAR